LRRGYGVNSNRNRVGSGGIASLAGSEIYPNGPAIPADYYRCRGDLRDIVAPPSFRSAEWNLNNSCGAKMNWTSLLQNWKTTLGGLLAAVPPVITAAGFSFTPKEQHWLALCQGLGVLLLGLAAKDSTTHSTVQQVNLATTEAEVAKIKP
jgi:hypothetical protein